ncbi:MAG: hypothetical protein JNL32_14325 [Candidatus Kapabacteria bacterium]|nr:hypothetical protein [Candidatus Kapabacteria bacterium]
MLDSLVDQLTLRNGYYDEQGQPRYTTGNIVSGALVRGFAVMIVGFLMWHYQGDQTTWFITIVLLWGYVAYPAYRQYSIFNSHVEQLQITTLCGQCKHFNPTNQLCHIYDEHVSNTHIPCEGVDWEPR